MIEASLKTAAACAVIAVLALGSTAAAQPPVHPGAASPHNMQGADEQSWINDPHMHAFYDLSVASLAHSSGKPDVGAYEQKAFAIFRAFGQARGMDPAKMQDHLKLIPRQVAQIAKDDPHVLDSYDNFVAATFGPR